MAELLESTMLVCFGLSWPMNLSKNIKAKSAKTMSLQFILLIIAGYIAGICAKFYNHKFNYVLVVYPLIWSFTLSICTMTDKRRRQAPSYAKNFQAMQTRLQMLPGQHMQTNLSTR